LQPCSCGSISRGTLESPKRRNHLHPSMTSLPRSKGAQQPLDSHGLEPEEEKAIRPYLPRQAVLPIVILRQPAHYRRAPKKSRGDDSCRLECLKSGKWAKIWGRSERGLRRPGRRPYVGQAKKSRRRRRNSAFQSKGGHIKTLRWSEKSAEEALEKAPH